MSEKVKYTLYALPISEKSLAEADRQRFCRVTSQYVLVYTSEVAPQHSVMIDEKEAKRLTAADSEWLADCNVVLITEELKRREAQTVKNLSEQLNRLEDALKQAALEEQEAGGSQWKNDAT